MKLLSTLLLIVLLFLTGQPPCMAVKVSETNCCSDSSCTSEEVPTEKDAHHSQKEDCGGCNPFQACSCCAAAVLLPAGFTISSSAVVPTESPIWSLTGAGSPTNWATDFWQPPRVG